MAGCLTRLKGDGRVPDDGRDWYDALDIGIKGQGWFGEIRPYHRLPGEAEEYVSRQTWAFAQHPAGLSVSFRTDSMNLLACWKLMYRARVPHMSPISIGGIDLYSRRSTRDWGYVATGFAGREVENVDCLVKCVKSIPRDYLVYLPLFTGLRYLLIGVDSGATVTSASLGRPGVLPVCFYGTSLTQGACASRPGMAYVNIVGRMLNVDTINLGFSGAGTMEISVAKLLQRVRCSAFVLDCAPNMSPGMIRDNCPKFIAELRASHGDVPISLVECPRYPNSWFFPNLHDAYVGKNAALKETFDSLVSSGDKYLHYLAEDEQGHSGTDASVMNHATDLFMFWYAHSVAKHLGRILRLPICSEL